MVRAPKPRRPQRQVIGVPPPGVDLEAVSRSVRYVGSPKHKTFPSFAGPPAPRADASKCDPSIRDADVVTAWLREAIRQGQVSEMWEGEFPHNVWSRVDGTPYEARLVNRGQGTYKGWPMTEEQWRSVHRRVQGGGG